jgi:hypothetical protein
MVKQNYLQILMIAILVYTPFVIHYLHESKTAKSARRLTLFLSLNVDTIKNIGFGCFISKASM